jgi:sugar O-acyltransferase (sialic acid O-acetyltransferase NeuD family)
MFYTIDGTRKNLIIFGTGTVARLAYYYFRTDSDYDVHAFCVDKEHLSQETFLDLPVVDFALLETSYPASEFDLFVALGYQEMNEKRRGKYTQAKKRGYTLARYVNSRTLMLNDGAFGDNCLIMEGAILQPGVRIGNNVIVWSGATIAHDSVIGDHCFLSSGSVVAGGVELGEGCFVGLGAVIRDRAKIGAHCLIGAGSIILEDAAPDGVYGVPSTPRMEFSSKTAMRFIDI